MRYEFFRIIFPFRHVKRSQPWTSTRVWSARVPVNVHSDTPLSATTKCRALFHLASGNIVQTSAKLARTASRPEYRAPQTSGPAELSKTQSSVMNDMSASTSCRFHASAKACKISTVISAWGILESRFQYSPRPCAANDALIRILSNCRASADLRTNIVFGALSWASGTSLQPAMSLQTRQSRMSPRCGGRSPNS